MLMDVLCISIAANIPFPEVKEIFLYGMFSTSLYTFNKQSFMLTHLS